MQGSQALSQAATTQAGARGTPRERLSFKLDVEEYGIDILKVQEIRGYEPPTRIANAPAFKKGLVNLRGVIVPIVDMRVRLDLADVQVDAFTVVIILNVASRTVGIVVDSVSDVLELRLDPIKPAPEFDASIASTHITGLGVVTSGATEPMLILLDIEQVLSSADMGLMTNSATACRKPTMPIVQHPALPYRLLMPLSLALALAWSADHARADRPLVSETANVIGAGDCELEAAVGQWRESNAASPKLMDAVVSCGWGGHSQLGVILAGARVVGATDKLVGLSGKTLLITPKDDATGVALAYSIWRSNVPGEGWTQGGGQLFGVATRELGKDLVGHANLGWLRTGRNALNHTTWSVGIEGGGPLEWAADVFGDDRSRPWLSAGVKLPLGETFSANLSYAQQFESPRVHLWTLGFKIEFK